MGFLSNLFGGNKEDKALREALAHIHRILDDEAFQLELVHPAMKAMLEVMFSALSVTCSPTYASVKPSSSASRKASRSSRSDCRQSLSRGWIGIVKKPIFMIRLPAI